MFATPTQQLKLIRDCLINAIVAHQQNLWVSARSLLLIHPFRIVCGFQIDPVLSRTNTTSCSRNANHFPPVQTAVWFFFCDCNTSFNTTWQHLQSMQLQAHYSTASGLTAKSVCYHCPAFPNFPITDIKIVWWPITFIYWCQCNFYDNQRLQTRKHLESMTWWKTFTQPPQTVTFMLRQPVKALLAQTTHTYSSSAEGGNHQLVTKPACSSDQHRYFQSFLISADTDMTADLSYIPALQVEIKSIKP